MTPRERAMDLHDRAIMSVRDDHQIAWKMMCGAVEVDPDFANGWYLIGHTCADQGFLEASIAAFRRCLRCTMGDAQGDLNDDLIHRCMVHLGHQLYRTGDLGQSEAITREAIARNPSNGIPHLNLSIIHCIAGRHHDAVTSARVGFELEPSPVTELGLALALNFAGQYAEGLRHFECRFAYKLPRYLRFPYPRWQGETLDGNLLVVSDQGMGDTLSFLRFVPAAAARVKKLVLSAHPELRRTIARTMPANVEFVPLPVHLAEASAWVSVMSLPVALGLTDAEIRDQTMPAYHTDPTDCGWKDRTAKLHVGIAWAGNPENDIDKWRSFKLTEFVRHLDLPRVKLYSLQVGRRANDVHELGLAPVVTDLTPFIRDAHDTAELMRALDCVVVCEGFHHHLAGTLGVRSHVLVSRNGGDWRCGRSGNTPLWYPNTSLYREQKSHNFGERNWDIAWGRIKYELML